MPDPSRIDARGPRFAASITAALLLVATALALVGVSTRRGDLGWVAYQPAADATFRPDAWTVQQVSFQDRVADPGFVLLLVIALLFVWGVAWPRTAPWGVLYRRLVQPRLAPPTEFEDPVRPASPRAWGCSSPPRGCSCTSSECRGRCRSRRRWRSSQRSSTPSSGCASDASSTSCCSARDSSVAAVPPQPERLRAEPCQDPPGGRGSH